MSKHDRIARVTAALPAPRRDDKRHQERRAQPRQLALLRVALLRANGVRDLCVVKNISPSGLSARIYRKLTGGEHVEVEFRSAELLTGSVVWTQGWEAGIVFPEPINVDSVLASRWICETGKRRTLPRVEIDCRGRLKAGLQPLDVSFCVFSRGG